MSLVDDQIIREERYNALDELSKRINKIAVKDTSAGINEIAKFETALENGRKEKSTDSSLKSKEDINSVTLLSDIMSDMGER